MVVGALFGFAAVAAAGCVARHCGRDDVARLGKYALLFAMLTAHVALLVAVTYSSVATNKAVASYVQESTELIRLERARVQGQQDAGDLGLASVPLPRNPKEGMTSTRDQITDLGGDTKEQAPNRTEAPPSSKRQDPTWRRFDFPTDHVLLFGCTGDEFTVRIMPRLDGFKEQTRRHAEGDLPDSCIRPAPGTLSNYDRHPHYQALFWSLPGDEKFVPLPLPLMVEDWEALPVVKVAPVVEAAPEAFTLSTDVVVFYRPLPVRSEIHIMARDVAGFMPISVLEDA
ncbi:hypothetical protein EJB05_36026, partial [Eragrostis curvula]